MIGVQNTAFYYAATGAVLTLFGVIGYLQHAPFVGYLFSRPQTFN